MDWGGTVIQKGESSSICDWLRGSSLHGSNWPNLAAQLWVCCRWIHGTLRFADIACRVS